jgi:ribonuclease P protein component
VQGTSDEPFVPGQQQFPRHERLTRKIEFLQIYEHGERRVGDSFILYAVRRAGQGRKMGCTVSRKVGGSVVRNRVKRYIREIYRKHRTQLPENAHLVIVARPRSAELQYIQCEEAIRRLLEKGELLDG